MNYELKSISPSAIFWNAARIFSVFGFVVAIVSFFIVPNSNVHLPELWRKCAAVGLFTVVYGVLISLVFLVASMLYNLWIADFNLRSFFLRGLRPFGIIGIIPGFAYNFLLPNGNGFFVRCLMTLIFAIIAAPLMTALAAAVTAIFVSLLGPFKGARVHLEQNND